MVCYKLCEHLMARIYTLMGGSMLKHFHYIWYTFQHFGLCCFVPICWPVSICVKSDISFHKFIMFPGWNELLIASFSHRSMGVEDGIVLATGLVVSRKNYIILTLCIWHIQHLHFQAYHSDFENWIVHWCSWLIYQFVHTFNIAFIDLQVHRSSAHQAGVGGIFDRVLSELVAKMKEMKMDKTELGCLRSIVLYNPG